MQGAFTDFLNGDPYEITVYPCKPKDKGRKQTCLFITGQT